MNKGGTSDFLKLFGIESDERELVGLVVFQAALFGFQNLFTRTAVFALFLETFTAGELPFLYIVTGLVVPLLGTAFSTYQRRTSRLQAYSISLNAVFVLLAGMVASSYILKNHPIAIFLLPVLYLAVFRFLELVLSGTKNTVFTLRQTKRLSGLISTGAKLSMLVGGLMVPLLLEFFEIQALILISVCMVFIAKLNQGRILKSAAIDLHQMSSDLTENNARKAIRVSEPSERQTYRAYVMWILAIQAGLSAMYFAIDNAFLAEVKTHFTTAEAVGTFLGYTSAAAALLSIILGPLSGRLLVPRFGTVTLVRLTPLWVLCFGTLAVLIAWGFPGTLWVLAAFTAIRIGERALTPTVFYPSYDSLFQSLPPEESARYHGFSLTFSGPLAGAAIGVVLLALGSIFELTTVDLGLLVLLVAAGMLVACRAIVGPYRKTLEYAVRSRRIERLSVNLTDDTSIAMLVDGLKAERSDELIYAFELLRENAPERARVEHEHLVSHGSMSVRVYMIKIFPELDFPDASARLIALLGKEKAPAVQSEILWALAQSGSDKTHELLLPYLEGTHHRLLKTAVAAMIKHGSLHSIISAGIRLEELQSSEQPEERSLAAEIIGAIGNPAFYHGLEVLISDPHLQVRQAALEAAGQLGSLQLLDCVLSGLSDPQVQSHSMAALRNYGSVATDSLWDTIRSSECPLYLKRQIVELLVRTPTSETRERLVGELMTDDLAHLHVCLAGLALLGLKATEEDEKVIDALVDREGGRAIDLLESAERYAAATLRGGVELRETLDEEYRHLVERILLVASFLMPGLPFRQISQSVFLGRNKDIAFFCELLEERLPSRLASRIVPLLEPLDTARRIDKLCKLYNQQPKDALTQLTELSKGSFSVQNPWLAVCATRFLRELVPNAEKEEPLATDSALGLEAQVRCLQHIDFFEGFPSSMLAQCLKYFQHQALNQGEVLVEKGEPQHALYVVLKGSLGCDGETFTEGAHFGLDGLLGDQTFHERIDVLEDSLVLTLNREVFLSVLRDSFLVYQTVLESLSSGIRTLIHESREDERKGSSEDASHPTGNNLVQQRLILNGTSLFGTLPPEELDRVLASSRFESFEAGALLVEDDAYSDTLYYVVSGEVILESGETIHARLVPGDHVGKLGFLGDEIELGLRAKVSQASTLLAVDGAAIDAMTWADRSTIWATLCHINEMKHRYAHRLVEFTWF